MSDTAKELVNVTVIVKAILKNDLEARDNDDYLYCKVCERFNAISVNEPFQQSYVKPQRFRLSAF